METVFVGLPFFPANGSIKKDSGGLRLCVILYGERWF